ncbi:hypothetical protein pb186bvf_020346 [Paramecium bursaria]
MQQRLFYLQYLNSICALSKVVNFIPSNSIFKILHKDWLLTSYQSYLLICSVISYCIYVFNFEHMSYHFETIFIKQQIKNIQIQQSYYLQNESMSDLFYEKKYQTNKGSVVKLINLEQKNKIISPYHPWRNFKFRKSEEFFSCNLQVISNKNFISQKNSQKFVIVKIIFGSLTNNICSSPFVQKLKVRMYSKDALN